MSDCRGTVTWTVMRVDHFTFAQCIAGATTYSIHHAAVQNLSAVASINAGAGLPDSCTEIRLNIKYFAYTFMGRLAI